MNYENNEIDWQNPEQFATGNHVRKNRKIIYIASIAVIAIVAFAFCIWHYSWLPINRDLSDVVGKNISVVKFQHPVTQERKGQYYINNYRLLLNKKGRVIQVERGRKSEKSKYHLLGFDSGDDLKETIKRLKDKDFYEYSENVYESKKYPMLRFEIAFDEENRVTKLRYFHRKGKDINKPDEDIYEEAKAFFDKGAYVNSLLDFKKLPLHYKDSSDYLDTLSEIQEEMSRTWRYPSSYSSQDVKIALTESTMEDYKNNPNAYAIASWERAEDTDGETYYQLQLRHLFSGTICPAIIKTEDLGGYIQSYTCRCLFIGTVNNGQQVYLNDEEAIEFLKNY